MEMSLGIFVPNHHLGSIEQSNNDDKDISQSKRPIGLRVLFN